MVAFTKMWTDVFKMVEENKLEEVKIVEKFKSGYVVLIDDAREFITKQDFVDFWCKLLYYNEISRDKIKTNGFKSEYVYKLVSKLPYVKENAGIVKVVE